MLKTRSLFYFGCDILQNENKLEFVQGSNTYTVDFQPSKYSPEQLARHLTARINRVLPGNFNVTFKRETRTLLFTSNIPFSIKISSGTFVGSSIFDKLGLGNSDSPLQLQWHAPYPIGIVYKPQFFLADYVSADMNKSLVGASVNETGTGFIEVVKYGIRRLFEFNIKFITDEPQINDFIEQDFDALKNTITFMDWAIEKRVVEFMPDRDSVDSYHCLILDSTQESQNGTGYKIYKFEGIESYYETGKLVWREVSI